MSPPWARVLVFERGATLHSTATAGDEGDPNFLFVFPVYCCSWVTRSTLYCGVVVFFLLFILLRASSEHAGIWQLKLVVILEDIEQLKKRKTQHQTKPTVYYCHRASKITSFVKLTKMC